MTAYEALRRADPTQGRKVLVLAPFPPRLDATHGGSRVMAELLAALAQRHRIALLCLRGEDDAPVDEDLRQACEVVEEVPRPWTGYSLLQQGMRASRLLTGLLLRSRPLWVTDHQVQAFAERVREVVRSWRPDVIQINYHVMGQYLRALDGYSGPRVLTEYEPGVRAAPYMARRHPAISRLIHTFDQGAWRRFEPNLLRRVHAVIVLTESDRRAVVEMVPSVPAVHIPLGTALPRHPLNPLGQQPPTLLFVGNFIHPPNADAGRRLVRSILPGVRARKPDVSLCIVGARPPADLRAAANQHVMVTGIVPSVEPLMDRASLVVAPLRQGGGTRVKVMEAMGAGKAIVASALAVEGLDVKDGEHVCLATHDDQFVDRIVELLDDDDRRASVARRARAWACANLGWERSVRAHEQLYDRLLRTLR